MRSKQMEDNSYSNIVATQGAFLIPPPHTPVPGTNGPDLVWADRLCGYLESLSTEQVLRRSQYGDAADEWPIGRTPPDLIEARQRKIKPLKDIFEGSASTPRSLLTSTGTRSPADTVDGYSPKLGGREAGAGDITLDGPGCVAVQETSRPALQFRAEESVPKIPRGKKRCHKGQEAEAPTKIRALNPTTSNRNPGKVVTTTEYNSRILRSRKRRRSVDIKNKNDEEKERLVTKACTADTTTTVDTAKRNFSKAHAARKSRNKKRPHGFNTGDEEKEELERLVKKVPKTRPKGNTTNTRPTPRALRGGKHVPVSTFSCSARGQGQEPKGNRWPATMPMTITSPWAGRLRSHVKRR